MLTGKDTPEADVSERGPASGLRRHARILRWGLATALLGLAIHLLALDPAPLRSLTHLPVHVLATMTLLIVCNQWLMSWRFKLVMSQCAGARLSHLQWFRLTSIGQSLSLLMPQLGHVHRGIILKRDHGMNYTAYASGLVVFLWFELLASFMLAMLVIGAYEPGFRIGHAPVLPILGVGFVALLVLPGALGALVGRSRLPWPRAVRALEHVRESLAVARAALGSLSFVLRFFALNVLVAGGHILMLSLAFGAVGGPLSLGKLMLFQVLLKLSNQVVLTPGNLGLTELAYGVLAQASATGLQHGIAVALLIRALGTVVILALGVSAGAVPVIIESRRRQQRPSGE